MWALFALTFVGVVYYWSNPRPNFAFDQTFTIAKAMLDGRLGVDGPRQWLELVPGDTEHYSVFPLGAVLVMLPWALGAKYGHFNDLPAAWLSACMGVAITVLAWLLSGAFLQNFWRRASLVGFLIFGNWMWCNLVFGGAWQYALGFSVIGQLGALYFLLVHRKPFWAGFFFAVAFGNRTDLLVITPIFLMLLWLSAPGRLLAARRRDVLAFAVAPGVLVLATLLYNAARFHSPFEMGYELIPFVFDQPGFEGGLFSWANVRMNARVMLLIPWHPIRYFPYFEPHHFGQSIVLCSPYLLCALRWPQRHRGIFALSWAAIVTISLVLFCHGNAGAYQYGYRYAISFLPWIFLALLTTGDRRPRWLEAALLGISIMLSGYAVYAFYWR